MIDFYLTGLRGVMGICSSSIQVFCGHREGLWIWLQEEYGVPGLLLSAVRSHVARVGAVCCQWVLGSASIVPCHWLCLWFSYLKVSWGRRAFNRSLLMVLMASSHCDLQDALGWSAVGCEEDRMSLRPWFSAGKRWIAPTGLGVSCCPKWRSSSISWNCSPAMANWECEINRHFGAAMQVLYGTVFVSTGWLCSNTHLFSWTPLSDRKNEIVDAGDQNEAHP